VGLLVAGGIAYARSGGDGDEEAAGGVAPLGVSSGPTATPSSTTPADELCTDEIRSSRRWVCITSAVVADRELTIEYIADFDRSTPDVDKGFHVHFYGSDGRNPPDHSMGSHVPRSKGKYYWDDRVPSVLSTNEKRYTSAIGDAEKVCARIAVAGHGLVRDDKTGYKTGNCLPITRPH